MQTTLRFLEAVLPANGLRVVAHKPPGWSHGFKHTFLATNAELIQKSMSLDANGVTTYFALATYQTQAGRTADNTVELQSLWLDTDAKNYGSPSEIAADIARIAARIGEPSYVIQSGGGCHAYWALRRPIPTAQWKPMADAFQAMWQELGVRADPISADAARILRLPGTHNRKYGEPREVKIAYEREITYDPDALASRLAAMAPKLGIPARVAVPVAMAGLNDDLGAGIEHKPSFIGPLVRKCRQMQFLYTSRATLGEPLWYATLQLTRHLDDGRKVSHLLSKDHPGYSVAETDAKLAQLESGDIGPTTCEHFKRINPSGCAGCEFNITSPIVLGHKEVEPAPLVVEREVRTTTESGEVVTVVQEETVAVPLPPPYTYDGHVMYVPKKDPETKMMYEAPVFRGLLYLERVSLDSADHQQMQLYVKSEGQAARHVVLPGSAKADKRSMATALATRGIQFMGNDASDILKMLNAMMADLRIRQEDSVTAEQMGWQEDASTFVVGSTAYRPRTTPLFDIPVPPSTRSVVRFYEPGGSLESWKAAATIYGKPGGESWQFALCYGAAGVLLPMTALSGAVLSLYSRDSGRGKSTVGEGALSWWGNPDGLKSQSKDTNNALFSKASRHKNLPVLVDEITDKPNWELEDLVYFMSQGREKERLTSDAAPRPIRPGWALPVILTSNNSVKAKLQARRGDAQGLFARVMEIPMDLPFADAMTTADSMVLRTGFKRNFGHAGPLLVRYVMENRDLCASMLDAITGKIVDAVGGAPSLRFWVATCACTLTVASIARTIGLLNYDVEALTTWAIATIQQQKHESILSLPGSSDVLAQFLEQNAGRILVAYNRRLSDGGVMPAIDPEDGIRGSQLIGRAEMAIGSLYLSATAFGQFCLDNGYDLGAFIRNAGSADQEAGGAVLLKSKSWIRVNLGKGTKTASARTRVLEFDLEHPALHEFARGITNRLSGDGPIRAVK